MYGHQLPALLAYGLNTGTPTPCHIPVHMLRSAAQDDGIKRWNIPEVLSMRTLPSSLVLVPRYRKQTMLPGPFCHACEKMHSPETPSMEPYQTYWHLDLGISSLPNFKKYNFFTCKLASLRSFVTAVQTNRDSTQKTCYSRDSKCFRNCVPENGIQDLI